MSFKQYFSKWADKTAKACGHPLAFVLAVFLISAWGLCGPYFAFSTNWQLVVNTGTTIITFLMVFVIQNSQNRDANALHAKLDEIIRASKAQNAYIGIDKNTLEEIEALRAQSPHHKP